MHRQDALGSSAASSSLSSTEALRGTTTYAALPVSFVAPNTGRTQIFGTCTTLRLKCDTCNMTVEQPDFSADQREKRAMESAKWRCVSCDFWHRQGHHDMGFVQRACTRCRRVVRTHVLDGPRVAAHEWMCPTCVAPPCDISVRYR